MTPQKICFRYDGSDEAKEALEIVNQNFDTNLKGSLGSYYYSTPIYDSSVIDTRIQPDYTLVTPSEFIRLMKGETKPKWKVGDECMVDGLKCKIHYVTDCGVLMLEDLGQTGYFHIRHSDFVSPIRKSLREEIKKLTCSEEVTNRILEFLKERGVEG